MGLPLFIGGLLHMESQLKIPLRCTKWCQPLTTGRCTNANFVRCDTSL